MARRRRLPVELTDEAHDGLDALAARHNTTKTTLLEALGLAGAKGRDVVWADVVEHARMLDRERRSRR